MYGFNLKSCIGTGKRRHGVTGAKFGHTIIAYWKIVNIYPLKAVKLLHKVSSRLIALQELKSQ